MRLISSSDSVLAGEFSALAILECLVSISVYIALCTYLNSWQPLLIAISIAPLFLLRTELSKLTALNAYIRLNKSYIKLITKKTLLEGNYLFLKGLVALFLSFIYAGAIALTGIFCRVLFTGWYFLRFPLITLSAMPTNWIRQALCTDLTRPPEIVPGENDVNDVVITFQYFIEMIKKAWKESWFLGLIGFVVNLPILILGFIPAYILRFSFKATSIIYVPFVWIANETLNTSDTLKTRLDLIIDSESEKIRRKFSIFILSMVVIIFFGIKLGEFYYKGFKINFDYMIGYIQVLIEPYPWPTWPVIFIIEVAITYFLFYYADRTRLRINGGSQYSESSVVSVLKILSFLRNSFAILTISIPFLIALSNVEFGLISIYISSLFG